MHRIPWLILLVTVSFISYGNSADLEKDILGYGTIDLRMASEAARNLDYGWWIPPKATFWTGTDKFDGRDVLVWAWPLDDGKIHGIKVQWRQLDTWTESRDCAHSIRALLLQKYDSDLIISDKFRNAIQNDPTAPVRLRLKDDEGDEVILEWHIKDVTLTYKTSEMMRAESAKERNASEESKDKL
jgi:hypothetical protein